MKTLPTLRQLRYLLAVAEHQHFGKAAEACSVTQSTLSAGFQELEALFAAPLCERNARRGITLTPLGHEMVAAARRVVAEAEQMVDLAQAAGEPLAGPLRLGVIPTLAPYVVPALWPVLQSAYPSCRLHLREVQSLPLIEAVREGRLDCGLLALPFDVGDLHSEALWQETLVAVLPAAHPLASCEQVSREELDGVDLVMLEDGHCLRNHALQACHLGRGRREDADGESVQATSLGTLLRMVAAGLGASLLPRPAGCVLGQGLPVVMRPVTDAAPVRTVALIWRPAAPRRNGYRRLAELLRQVGREL